MKFFLYATLLLAPFFLVFGEAAEKRLLIIYSHSMGFAQHYAIINPFYTRLNSRGLSYHLTQIELNQIQSWTPEIAKARLDELISAIRDRKFDVILTVGEPALQLLIRNHKNLPPETPVVSTTEPDTFGEFHNLHPNSTGVMNSFAPKENIRLIRRLFPKTKQILLIANWTHGGKLLREQVAAYARNTPEITFHIPQNETTDLETVFELVRNLPPDSAILFQGWFNRNAINFTSLQYLLTNLENQKNAPLFIMYDSMLSRNTVGGVFSSSTRTAEWLAGIVQAIFFGKKASDFPPVRIVPSIVLNWESLQEYHIPPQNIPVHAKLVGRPKTFFEKNKKMLILGIASSAVFLVLLAAIILFYLWHRRLENRRTVLFSHLPCQVVVSDEMKNLLFSHTGNPRTANWSSTHDYPLQIRNAFEEKISTVFRTSARQTLDYQSDHSYRHAEFFPLDKLIFGKKTVMWISNDISELEQARTMLQNAKQLLQNIIDSLSGYIYMKETVHYRYTFCNKMFCDLLNLPQNEIIGKTNRDLLSREEAEKYEALEREAVRTNSTRSCIVNFNGSDGTVHKGKLIVQTQINENGEPEVFGMLFDLTKEIRLAEELHISLEHQNFLNSILEKAILISDVQKAIHFVVDSIRVYLKADCACILKYDPAENTMCFLNDYAAGPTEKIFSRGENFPMETAQTLHQKLVAKEPVCCFDLSRPDPDFESDTWENECRKKGILSLYAGGIYLNNELWASIGMFYMEKQHKLSRQDLQLLQNTGHVIELLLTQKGIHEQLNWNEHEKRLIIETIPIPILLFGSNNSLLMLNEAARTMYRLTDPKESFPQILKTENSSPDDPLPRVLADLAPHFKSRTLNGHDYHESAYPIMIGGQLSHVLVTYIDMTEFNRTRRQLIQSIDDAQQASKTKSYFLASMSHELRTPLNAVIGFCELLQGSSIPPDEQEEYLNAIRLAGNTLLRLINDILDLSKIEAEQVTLAPKPTDLTELIEELLPDFHQTARQKNLRLTTDLPPDLPPLLLDSLRVRQILMNLIGNAFKFTPKGGVAIRLEQKPAPDKKTITLKIHVKDTGIGIDPDKRQSIFEPFSQQDTLRDTHLYKGTGLGLTISNKMAMKMNGSIELESKVGKGSTFTLILPDVQVVPEKQRKKRLPADTGKTVPLPARLDVLLVDDIPVNLRILSAILAKFGFTVRTASSGTDALESMEKNPPGLVLTDMWMPGMNGSELAGRIRANAAWNSIPVGAVTADNETDKIPDAGTLDFILLKPITTEKIRSALEILAAEGKLKPN